MIDTLREYVWETDEDELNGLRDSGYDIFYFDVSLSVIYEEISTYYSEGIDQWIEHMFGYYGPGVLLHVAGTYYWLMQA